jgi:glycosyltransferase involved in cell wall biosynthesis
VTPRVVVLFTDSDGFAGAEVALLTLLRGLDRRRFTPLLAHHDHAGIAPLAANARELGIETWMVPAMPHGVEGLRRVPAFAVALRRRGAAVFHAHLPWPLAAKQALLGAIAARVPAVVATLQLYMDLPISAPMRAQQRIIGTGVGRFVVVSEDMRARVSAALPWPAEKLAVIHNAVDAAALRRRANPALRRRLVGERNRPLVLVPARLDGQKGHVHLLAAAEHVPDAVFALAGEGAERDRLHELARGLGVQDRVVFLGQRHDVAELLAVCDVVVLPSLDEGLSVAVLEAMAVGRPVVASAVGGTPEAVHDGVTGLLVPPANPAQLAAAIRRVIEDRALAERLGDAARARAETAFSASTMVERISAVYDDLLARR